MAKFAVEDILTITLLEEFESFADVQGGSNMTGTICV